MLIREGTQHHTLSASPHPEPHEVSSKRQGVGLTISVTKLGGDRRNVETRTFGASTLAGVTGQLSGGLSLLAFPGREGRGGLESQGPSPLTAVKETSKFKF